jgi:hypothetical protein
VAAFDAAYQDGAARTPDDVTVELADQASRIGGR